VKHGRKQLVYRPPAVVTSGDRMELTSPIDSYPGGAAMNGRTFLGVALIVIGVIALVYQSFTYTTRKKVLDIGPIQATKEEHHSLPVPPVIGVLALVSGVAVLALGRGK
jgi:hypothetical protein